MNPQAVEANTIIYCMQKKQDLLKKIQYSVRKTILVIGAQQFDSPTTIEIIHGVIDWMTQKEIQINEHDFPICAKDDDEETKSQIISIQFKGFTFNIIVKETTFGRIVGVTANDFTKCQSNDQKQYFVQFFDIVIKSFIQKSSEVKIYSPVTMKVPTDDGLQQKLDKINKYIKFPQGIQCLPILFGIRAKNKQKLLEKILKFKNMPVIDDDGSKSSQEVKQFFNDCYSKECVQGNFIQTYKKLAPEFNNILIKNIKDTEMIIQGFYMPQQQIIKHLQLYEKEATQNQQKNKFLLDNDMPFQKMQQKLPVPIQSFLQAEIKHYIRDGVFLKFQNKQCQIKTTTNIPPNLAHYYFLSELKKIINWFTAPSLNGIQNVLSAVQRIKQFFQNVCSIDNILVVSQNVSQQFKPKKLGKMLSAVQETVSGLLAYRQFTGASLAIASNFYDLVKRTTPDSKSILAQIIGKPLIRYQNQDYYDVIITLVSDLLKDMSTSKKEGNQFSRACDKYKSTAQFYKTERILKSYLDNDEKLLQGIKILIDVYERSQEQGSNENINLDSVLTKAAYMLRIIGLSNKSKYIYKKQKKIFKFKECLFQEAQSMSENDKCSLLFDDARCFIQWGFPQVSKELYQYVYENSSDAEIRVAAKLKILQLAKSNDAIHHDEMFNLDRLKQKFNTNTSPEDSFYDKLLYDYEQEKLEKQLFIDYIKNLDYSQVSKKKKLSKQKINQLRQRLSSELIA